MSNNKDQTTARDYIKSFINGTDSNEYLEKEQPQFDPTKSVPAAQPEPIEKEEPQLESIQPNNSFNIHLPTQNPIPRNEQEQKQPEQQQQQQYHSTSRGIREQRGEIHETALTICADLNEDLLTCFNNGSWWDKAKMCEEQKQKFWNCFNSQKKFLKDVNYKGPINTEKDDDRILLAAYKLRDKLDEQQK